MNAAANMLRSVLNTSRAAMSSGIPKRPPTSYMLFAKAQRAAGAVDASLKVPEQGKAIGAAWRALSESAKGPYEAESLRLREAYAAEVKAYTETHGTPPPSKKALKQSQPKKKRAPSAYAAAMASPADTRRSKWLSPSLPVASRHARVPHGLGSSVVRKRPVCASSPSARRSRWRMRCA